MKKLLFPVIFIATLASCGTKPELRADIKEFISQFSLVTAMDTYKKGGYTSVVVEITSEKKTQTTIEMEFSYLDSNHPTYVETTTNYIDDVIDKKTVIEFVEIEEKYYLSTNGELKESSLDECAKLIRDFFYTKTELEGEYHVQGWYYGDYVKNVAPVMQEYVTIDQEKELYILDYEVHGENEYHQNYSVNRYGMLVENHVSAENVEMKRTTDVVVHD